MTELIYSIILLLATVAGLFFGSKKWKLTGDPVWAIFLIVDMLVMLWFGSEINRLVNEIWL